MTTVTAAVAREHHAPLTLEQLELDEIRDDEVRVRMVATGVCHTDAVVRDGGAPTPLPAVLGHEGTGVVEQVGKAITTVRPGDHVVLAAAYCGTCRQCRAGRMAYCENLFAQDFGGRRTDGSTAFSAGDGTPIASHFFGQSSFSTYANVVESSIVRVDPSVPPEVLAPLGAASTPVRVRCSTSSGHRPDRRRGDRRRGRRPRSDHGRPGCRLHDDRCRGPARLTPRVGTRDRCHPHDQLKVHGHGRRAVGHHRWRGRQLRPRHHRGACCGQQRRRGALHPGNAGSRGSSGPRHDSRHRHRCPFPREGVDVQDDRPGQLGSRCSSRPWWSCGSRGGSRWTSWSRPTSSTTSTPPSTTRSRA